MTYLYLASPYTHEDPFERLHRFQLALRASHWLIQRGISNFSPIVHTHPMAFGADDVPFEKWERYDKDMIAASGGLILLMIPGWRRSKGCAAEIAFAKELGLSLYQMVPMPEYPFGYEVRDWDGSRPMTREDAITEKTIENGVVVPSSLQVNTQGGIDDDRSDSQRAVAASGGVADTEEVGEGTGPSGDVQQDDNQQ